MLRPFLTALALTWVCAAPLAASETPWQSWQTRLHADSPQAGRIWDVRAGAEIAPADMAARLTEARFALIGEVHDNPDHHRLQGWVIAQLAEAGASPTVVMEMITRDKADVLSDYLAMDDASAEGLGAALNWSESGWPDWKYYQPIADAALNAGLPIAPGNPPRQITRKTAQNGFDSLKRERRTELALDEPLSKPLAEALGDELYDGHCQLLARERLAPMAKIQRLRDAFMADGLISADRETAALIAGNGHVRADRGVPWYLRRRAPDSETVVVMLVELDGSGKAPAAYVQTGPDGAPTADFVWLTPRAERPDPCEQMRRMFQRRGGGN